MQRRDFIKTGCTGCLGLVGLSLLQSCSPGLSLFTATAPDRKTLTIPVAEFAGGKNMLLVRNSKLDNDILLIKKEDGYKALYMQCTHADLPLTVTSKKIYCNAHGSVFDFEGNVLKEPAFDPLKQFKTEVKGNDIIIKLS